MEIAPQKDGRSVLVAAVIAVSAVLSAFITYFTFAMPSADPPGTQPGAAHLAVWLMFTVLLALMFTAGIWRMSRPIGGVPSAISPMTALIVLAVVIGLCGSSVIAVGVFSFLDPMIVILGMLAIAIAAGFLIIRSRTKAPPPGGASA